MAVPVKCFECGTDFSKSPSLVREHNFCCKQCRLTWMSKNNTSVINVPGHTKGIKRPHLSELNRTQNRMNKKGGWTQEEREKKREQALKQRATIDKGRAYRKYYGRHLHRVIMEKETGRVLSSEEIVHHIDENILNNAPENLMIVTRQEHARIHFHNKNQTNGTSN